MLADGVSTGMNTISNLKCVHGLYAIVYALYAKSRLDLLTSRVRIFRQTS